MSPLSFDDEDYYFQIAEELEEDKQFILIIYDIVDNKRRVKFANFWRVMEKEFKNQHLKQCFLLKDMRKWLKISRNI